MKHIKSILLLAAFSFSLGLFAQHNEEVTIEGTYRPKVNKVNKIQLEIEKPEASFTIPSPEVKILDIDRRLPYHFEKISALNYKAKEALDGSQTENFLMAGLGTRLTPVFLYNHNSKLSKTLGLGVGIKHLSSWLGIKDYAYSGFMNNAFDLNLTSSRFSNLQVGGGVYYKNDMVHDYGINTANWAIDETTLEKLAPRKMYNTVGARFGLASANTRTGESRHELNLDYHYFFGGPEQGAEHFGGLDYDVSLTESWWGKKNHPQRLGTALAFQFDHTAFPLSLGMNRMMFKVNPYFEMKDDFYRLHLGVRLDGAKAFGTANRLLTVHPDLKGSLFVLNNSVEFYAGLNGGRKLYTYSELVAENPFLASDIAMEVTTVKLGFEGGVRTNLMKTMDLHAGVRYRHTMNDPFYTVLSQTFSGHAVNNRFEVFYDDSRVVSVLADLRWLAFDKVTIDAGFAYHKYHTAVLDHALYRPEMEAKLKLNYDPTQQLSLYSSFLFQGGRYGRVDSPLLTTPSFRLKPVMDLGIGADYKVSDELTVFGKIDNLLHQRYELFVNYPVTGFQFFAGVKMRF